MEQTKALNALEPFLALSKSATVPRAAADLVTQATSNANTFVFAELLQTPQIQALAQSPDHAHHLKLLEIFSYGTYATYTATANLPQLNPAQHLKLRQLSLLTLAKDPHNLSYAALQQSLSLDDARAVENLVISAIYAGLVDAQLDPRNGFVRISSVSPLRDLAPGSIPSMLSSLREWSGRCTSTLEDLEAQIASIRAAAAKRASDKKAWDEQIAKLVEDEKTADQGVHGPRQSAFLNRTLARMQGQRFNKRGSGSLDGNPDDDEAMDVDEEELDDGEGGSGAGGGALGGPGKKRANRRKL
ncbi:PCI domain-containing protein [Xylaria venustula]|nr:PCI domain-containing protein [Xylaria venustula]